MHRTFASHHGCSGTDPEPDPSAGATAGMPGPSNVTTALWGQYSKQNSASDGQGKEQVDRAVDFVAYPSRSIR